MKKEISKEEKLEFFKKFHEKEFHEKYREIDKLLYPIGFGCLKAFSIIGVLGSIILSPWLALCFIPAFITPTVAVLISESKRKKAIESLTENISYGDFKKIHNSDEWKQLAEEHCDRISKELHEERKKNSSSEAKKSKKNAYDIEISDEEAKEYMF